MRQFGMLVAVALVFLSGCVSSEISQAQTLVRVTDNAEYNAEQVHAICNSEALDTRAAIRANRPTRITVSRSGGGFSGGFADGFNRNFNPGPSGNREGKAAYASCAARHGYVIR